ncbi:hypothetical protein GOODEAATRI_027376, partial [Goodea atripinnis]
ILVQSSAPPDSLPSVVDREVLLRSQEEAQRLQRRAVRHQEKRDKIERHNRRLGELLERRNREHQSKLSQLAALRREHILELTTHIFPMQEEKQGSSTVTELAEARRTTYLSGRWIWDDQNGETSISITGAPVALRSNGDCSAYYSWVEEKSTSPGPGKEGGSRAGLHVNSDKLHPHHTLRNIMFLVAPDNDNLGWTGPFEVSSDLEESMEFVEPEVSGPTEESGDEAVTDEETDLGMDWETVPSPRFCDIPSQVGTLVYLCSLKPD